MSPIAVFVRTLLKSSAIFIGAAAIFLQPAARVALGARRPARRAARRSAPARAGNEAMVDGLIALLKDTDAGVRRQAVRALAS